MGWSEVDLKGVNPNYETVAPGDYTFQILPGAKIDDYGSLSFQVNVTSDGDFKGRRIFPKLPDPNKENMGWVIKALKRLEQAVGIEQDKESGEDVVAWMNRLGNEFARFNAPLTNRTYVNKSGENVVSEDIKFGKATPAA